MKFHYNQSAMVKPRKVEKVANSLREYREELKKTIESKDYSTPESSLRLPYDETMLKQVKQIAQAIRRPTLQYVIVIGIGGSNLGAQAVYEAIAGSMNLLVDRLPKLLFLDTVSDEKMTSVARVLERQPSKDDFAAIIISKSGTTTETIANTEVLWAFVEEHFGNPCDRFAVITDEGSKLWDIAQEKKILCLSIPKNVGGRFSVMSAVGLLPLALANIDVDEMLSGARDSIEDGISEDTSRNHAIVSASLTFIHHKRRPIHNTFHFSPKLESTGKWYRQLVSESLGKNNRGFTPIVSIGSADLHSQAQLYWGGRDDKWTNIVYSFYGNVNYVPQSLVFHGLVQNLARKSLEDIQKAILGGVKSAYEKTRRPYLEIDLEGINARELGYYLQFRMLEVMYLARLMRVYCFDQPQVELYKITTRELLDVKTSVDLE
jgi:glucose-6-phosphate isomerase